MGFITDIPGRPEPGSFRRSGVWKLDAVVLAYGVVIRTARPLVDVAAAIAPDRPLMGRRTFDPAVGLVEALLLGAVAEILGRSQMRVAPQADLRFTGGIFGCGISLPVGGCLIFHSLGSLSEGDRRRPKVPALARQHHSPACPNTLTAKV